jgi:dephospho-CoA kinase
MPHVEATSRQIPRATFRPVGAPVWRASLLFRDWLRANPDERDEYERLKLGLGAADDAHVDSYSHDKMPWVRAGLARAEPWARDQDRRP